MSEARIIAEGCAAPLDSGGDILRVDNLTKHFSRDRGVLAPRLPPVRAVEGVSFTLRRGEVLGLVGESGCGKSTLALLLLRLIDATSGRIAFEGTDITRLGRAAMRPLRRRLQIIFQDPYSSLNPRLKVGRILGEPLLIHRMAAGDEIEDRVGRMLEVVGLPAQFAERYPHELSGGQRQRIGIARALIVEPLLVVADEAVSALDVSIQAQILNLLADLRERFRLSMIAISHDISVIQHVSDRIAVMYLGAIVETAAADDVVMRPLHPYTEALLSAVPLPDPAATGARRRIVLEGDPPSPAAPPPGCRFHTRCRFRRETCATTAPALREVEPGRHVACHFAEELFSHHLGGPAPRASASSPRGV